MKKYILYFLLLPFSYLNANAQIADAVKATIVSNATNEVTIYGKSSVALVNKHTDNVVVSVSIADPGVGNRPIVSILTNHLPDVIWTVGFGSPYLEGGRYHYDFIANNSISSPGVSTINWAVNQSYPLITLSFSNSNGFPTARLDHWDAQNFGLNGNSQWYFQIIQGGGGDITAQTNLFYGSTGVVNDPGGWGAGTSFVPVQPITVLPVRFTNFAVEKDNNNALISWKVQNESTSTSFYEVERSIDGFTFDKIKTLNPVFGNSENFYNLVDKNLSSIKNMGIIYYRIKQVDIDGKFVYSEIRSVRLDDKAIFVSAFPNPAKEFTIVRIDAIEAGQVLFNLVNVDGKQVMTTTMQAQKGSNLKKIDMSTLARGSYFIKVLISGELKTIGVIKL
jgi:hypothetical protein